MDQKMLRKFHLLSTIFSHFLMGQSKELSEPPLEVTSKIIFSKDFSIHNEPKLESDKPLQVNFSIEQLNILDVVEKSEIITLEMNIKIYWRDPRISVRPKALSNISKYVSFNSRVAEYFWIPDIFIDKAKSIRNPLLHVKPAYLRVYNNFILFSNLINFDVFCEMDFHRFPVDEQLCIIIFESYGFASDQFMFAWDLKANNINTTFPLTQYICSVRFDNFHEAAYDDLVHPGT
nr:gamma-aminobutyric acid receptor subunit delta-like [Lepeophtheirus salmonis]